MSNKQSRRRVTVDKSTASVYGSLQLTVGHTKDTSFSSCAGESNALIDSFELNIDFSGDDFRPAADESFEDHYSESKSRLQQRQRQRNEGGAHRHHLVNEETSKQRCQRSPQGVASQEKSVCFAVMQQSHQEMAPGLIALHSSEDTRSGSSRTSPSRLHSSPASSLRPTSLDFPLTRSIPTAPSYERVDEPSTASHASSIPELTLNPKLWRAQQQRLYWSTVVERLFAVHGSYYLETADARMELGQASLQANEFGAAKENFQAAYCTYRRFRKTVACAKALDRLGVATSHLKIRGGSGGSSGNNNTYPQALRLLHDAFWLRKQELGLWHVDTVDTMNRIARVHCLADQWNKARRAYWEVFWVRKAIFGAYHPSVAVAAHDLANAFCRLGKLSDADNFYQLGLEIYDRMGLSASNPAVAKLLRDMKQLKRLERLAEI